MCRAYWAPSLQSNMRRTWEWINDTPNLHAHVLKRRPMATALTINRWLSFVVVGARYQPLSRLVQRHYPTVCVRVCMHVCLHVWQGRKHCFCMHSRRFVNGFEPSTGGCEITRRTQSASAWSREAHCVSTRSRGMYRVSTLYMDQRLHISCIHVGVD